MCAIAFQLIAQFGCDRLKPTTGFSLEHNGIYHILNVLCLRTSKYAEATPNGFFGAEIMEQASSAITAAFPRPHVRM